MSAVQFIPLYVSGTDGPPSWIPFIGGLLQTLVGFLGYVRTLRSQGC